MKNALGLLALPTFILCAFAQPAMAAAHSPAVLGSYWSGFLEHWQGVFQQQTGITWAILAVGAVALFIITRGKWLK